MTQDEDAFTPPSPITPRAHTRSWLTAAVRATPPPAPPSSTDDKERWTVGRLLSWTADYLKRHGSESPRLDTEVLLAQALGWQRVQLYTQFQDEVAEAIRAHFRELVRQRAEGAPVAYLVGRKEFYSLPLKVTPAVLIPRPDSEFVVVEFLTVARTIPAPKNLDVGTGSGCLALACAHQHSSATFIATDNNADALAVASSNAEALGLSGRVSFRAGNLLEPASSEGPFDVILSNPPYIPTNQIANLEHGVRDYEPHAALDGGVDGLKVVAPLIEQAVVLLKPGGHLILEIGSDQEEAVRTLLSAQPDLGVAPTVRDHANHPRVLRATRIR
ncbi:MAG: peptide chain release factor N(5)-glutamine methyltransferase [Isosphaeraceae bacterium]